MKARRQSHKRQSIIAQTPHTGATLTLKVGVQVVESLMMFLMALATFLAQRIAGLSLAVLNAMHHIVLPQECESAEHRTLIHRTQFRFQFAQRIGTVVIPHSLQHQQAYSRRAYAMSY